MEHLLFIAIGLVMAGLVTMIIGVKSKTLTTIGLVMISLGGAGMGYMAVEEPAHIAESLTSKN